ERRDRELYESRTVVKHLAMRRTLWIVRAEDLPSVQAGASDRVAGNEHRKLVGDVEKAGVAADGAQWVATACEAVLTHLREHGPTGAAQLRTALPELAGSFNPAPGKRWGGETPLSPRVLTVLGVRGEIVRGPNDSGWTNSRPRWTVTS
ncbi:DNA glycosylase AlkZ-like family protein, partial [Mycobacterium syngnathidarum]|uniref:DNA glycosylase AlkZ-like family protein n=1 Tax=Mycobacterium syngnathidarum TaxID=1908205 RepID=UPI000AD979C4